MQSKDKSIKKTARRCNGEAASPNTTTKSYHKNPGMSTHLPKFPESVKKRWAVKRDANGDEYIRMNGKKALGKNGIDHIYLISKTRVGVWLTGRNIKGRIKTIKTKVPGLKIEQIGDGEAILSVRLNQIDALCHAVNARQRRKISDKERKRLQRISPFARKQKSLCKSTIRTAKTVKTRRAG